jgi:hypothetical protein
VSARRHAARAFATHAAWLPIVPALLVVAAPAFADDPAPRRLFDAAPDTSTPPAAAARPPRVALRLEYTRGAGAAEACPDERGVRGAMAARLGYDPVSAAPGALPTVRISVTRQAGGFVAVAEKRDPGGRVEWTRPALVDGDCRHLIDVLGLSIAIAIDPGALGPGPSAAILSMEPAPPASPPASPIATPAAPPLSTPRPAFRFGLRAGLAVATAPAPAATLAADVGVRGEAWSVSLEGRADLPVTADVDQGVRLRTSVLAGALVPCGHWRWFVGCGVVAVGSLRLEAVHADPTTALDRTTPHAASSVYAAAGARVGLEWPIPSLTRLALRLSGEALVTLHPVQGFRTSPEASAWVTPPFAGVFGAGAVMHF